MLSARHRPRERLSATAGFEALARRALLAVVPAGVTRAHFTAPVGADCYRGGVKPDFVMPDGRWVDFKLHVSYREKRADAPWKPSALYSSLRKYIDHPANQLQTLTIVYRHLHGTLRDVEFPVTRGRKVLLADAEEFSRRVRFVDIERVLKRLEGTKEAWVAAKLREF